MEHVGARARDDIDDSARRAAKLGRIATGLDLDLLDKLREQGLGVDPCLQVRGVNPVDEEPVVGPARAVDGEAAALCLQVGAGRQRHD